MLRRASLLALPLLMVACDKPSEEELRSMMQEVATEVATKTADEKVAPLTTKHEELAATVEANGKQARRIDELEKQMASLTASMVSLESEVAEAEVTIEELEAEMKKEEALKAKPSVPSGRPDPAAYYKVVVGDAQTIGASDALVTIVTWSDFQCPFCSRVTPTIETLRKDYGKDLRYVFMHNPLAFHTNARAAAIAAEAAGEQGKFFEMHDKLFENQRDLTEKNFIAWAKELGLNMKQFKRALDSSTLADKVDRQQKAGVALGARGTPAFFVNGRFLSGAQPVPAFKALIDEEMTKARAKVAAGTSRDRVYAETIASGRTAP